MYDSSTKGGLYIPTISKGQALGWAIGLTLLMVFLFWINQGGCAVIFLLIAGGFWGLWYYKYHRDRTQAALHITRQHQSLTPSDTHPVSQQSQHSQLVPPLKSAGSDGLFVPPPLH